MYLSNFRQTHIWDPTKYFLDRDRYFGQDIMIKGKILLDLAQYFESKYPLDIIQPLALNDAMDRRFIACQIFPLFIGNLVQKHISDRDTKMLHMKELAGRCNLCQTWYHGVTNCQGLWQLWWESWRWISAGSFLHCGTMLLLMMMWKRVFVYEWCRTWCGVSRPDRRLSPQIVR